MEQNASQKREFLERHGWARRQGQINAQVDLLAGFSEITCDLAWLTSTLGSQSQPENGVRTRLWFKMRNIPQTPTAPLETERRQEERHQPRESGPVILVADSSQGGLGKTLGDIFENLGLYCQTSVDLSEVEYVVKTTDWGGACHFLTIATTGDELPEVLSAYSESQRLPPPED